MTKHEIFAVEPGDFVEIVVEVSIELTGRHSFGVWKWGFRARSHALRSRESKLLSELLPSHSTHAVNSETHQ